jgi:Protein of unknown function (DUF3089)
MHKSIISLLILVIIGTFCSCSNKLQSDQSNYQFKSKDGAPDYGNLGYWAAHPWKNDPSDSVPAPLRKESRDSTVDVFFLHPTSYTSKLPEGAKINASIFNRDSRVFAPRYRQAHLSAYYISDKMKALAAFEMAYRDIKAAFQYYMEHYNQGRPVIIAAHSQGSTHGMRLLKEFFENKPLRNKLVVAYLVGMPISKKYFKELPVCKDSTQTGCVCVWRTFREGYDGDFAKAESWVTNPITWTTGNEKAGRNENAGSVLKKFNKLKKRVVGARVEGNILIVQRPRFFGSFLIKTKVYHVGDYNLFYMNVRKNTATRIGAFWKR